MTGREMWDAYIRSHPENADKKYEAWCYGSDAADELAQLTAAGIKTGTASAYPLYEQGNETLPKTGEYNVITLTDDTAICVTETTRVYVIPFKDVSVEHAWREGEGDRSLDYWRRVHEEFFTQELRSVGMEFSEDMLVVCEEFEVVFR